MEATEVNFDGLVGPTHNYAGLSFGNVASQSNQKSVSHPKEAALQGLHKMKALHDRGFVQGILPPQERPNLHYLRSLGFSGSDQAVLARAGKEAPLLLAVASSAASMWTANAATVSPSADTADHKVHFTPANLLANAHRSQEATTTYHILKRVFADESRFMVHPPVGGGQAFGDEGAANHIRLCEKYGERGIEVFVYGREAFNTHRPSPKKYPARQTLESYQVIARHHQLSPEHTIFVQQNPEVIDQGVFHNDVISVGNGKVLFHHEEAFLDPALFLRELREKFPQLISVLVSTCEVSVSEAVKTYLFNTQLLNLPDGSMLLVAPNECQESPAVRAYLERLQQDKGNPINEVIFFDLRQSMRNGGGPACLRLRVALQAQELAAMNQACLFNDELYSRLVNWVNQHYRDEITPEDLRDPQLLQESRQALDELTRLLKLDNVYQFQA
jgi:succinylarginine dihydrolase